MMTQKERTSRYMPSIGPKTRKPAYASFEKINGFHRLIGAKSNPSWYQHWINRTLSNGNNLFISSLAETVLRRLFATLKMTGLVKTLTQKAKKLGG